MNRVAFVSALVLVSASALADRLIYHEIQTGPDGRIVPWFSPDPGKAYDHNIRLIWQFWHGMRNCPNGVRYYMQHQVWKPDADDGRGLGGDQINMALSSWTLLYNYTGDPAVKADMIYMADFWLDHGLSPADEKWGNLPYPYNTDMHSGIYDGDMKAGKKFLQPDKAANFGYELVNLYRMTGQKKYLDAAVKIANTLAANVTAGDAENSPWSFRVHSKTNQVHRTTKNGQTYTAAYTANWAGALMLFESLTQLKQGKLDGYARAHKIVIDWIKAHPLKTNNWGPFFEDIPTDAPSNTETNADTMAMYILEHPTEWGPTWKEDAQKIIDWSLKTFANRKFEKFGVVPINEQTVYMKPGNSHTSHHASVELLFCEKTGDLSRKAAAIARLNWATYMVDDDGKNRYPEDDIWLTDGYGDYARYYLRSMASFPGLSPADQNHLLRTTSTIQIISYGRDSIRYTKFDAVSKERLELGEWAPARVEGGTMRWDPAGRVLEIESTDKTVAIQR